MRITVTLDDDVATTLERLRKGSDRSFKELVNEALRQGLRHMDRKAPRPRFRTRTVDPGRCPIGSLDGSVLRYVDPLEPVDPESWEAEA